MQPLLTTFHLANFAFIFEYYLTFLLGLASFTLSEKQAHPRKKNEKRERRNIETYVAKNLNYVFFFLYLSSFRYN